MSEIRKQLTMKAVSEIFKLASRIGIKPRDIIGQGADVIKMGISLFNTKVNPKLTEFISKKGEIPTKILEELKIHLRSLKNVSDNQLELFKLNLKDIVNAKSPVTSVKQSGTLTETLTQNELKYLTDFINDTGGGKFTSDIMSEVPSLRIIGDKITLNKKDINKFSQFLDDAYISDLAPSGPGVNKMPPRLRDATNNLLTKLLRSEKAVPETSIKKLATDILPRYTETPGAWVRGQTMGTKEYYLNEIKLAYPNHYKNLTGKESTAELKEIIYRLDTEGIPFTHGGIANHFRNK